MGSDVEKRTAAALGGVALLVIVLLPLAFRELEPDYGAAYSMDPARRKRFASRDEKPPELTGLPAAASASADGPARRGPGLSVHRAPVSAPRARPGAPEQEGAAPGAPAGPAGSSAGSAPAPRLLSGPGLGSGTAGSGPDASRLPDPARAPGLEDARFGKLETAPAPDIRVVGGAAGAAAAARSLGLGEVAGMLASGNAAMAREKECLDRSGGLRSRIAAASAEHRAASDELRAAGCAGDACGRYAEDCRLKERSPEEARVSARLCRCDRLACRKIETCRRVAELVCEEKRACSHGQAVTCGPSCD